MASTEPIDGLSVQPKTSLLVVNKPADLNLFPAELKTKVPRTPNQWFSYKYPELAKLYGSPFLEMEVNDLHSSRTHPMKINHDFFAAVLGGEKRLGHRVIYYLPELQFYFYDPADQLFKATTQEKLQTLLRAKLMKCAEGLPGRINILPLYDEFRSDATTKTIIQRAKSILAADETFFKSESANIRNQGPELPERLARVLVDSMLEKRDGAVLTVTQAYALFCGLAQQKRVEPVNRALFRSMMADLMREVFDVSVRRDLVNEENKMQEGWKGVGAAVEAQVTG